jgi:hypothetical protein
MMKTRKLISISATATLAIVAVAPSATYADAAMDACIEAFVAERVPKDRAVRVRKLSGSNAYTTGTQRITLTAKGSKSGKQIASATCVVSDRGDSVSLQDTQESSTLAATLPASTTLSR